MAATNRDWIGGSGGSESEPLDIYKAENWSHSTSPTTADNLKFTFNTLTYLTSSMDNAADEAVCTEVNFNDGTSVLLGAIRSAGTFRFAQTSGKTVEVRVAEGGTLYSGYILAIGCGGTATLTVNGGTVYSASELRVGNGSTATLTINSGTVEMASGKILALPASGTGTINLNGGTMKTTCIKNTGGNKGTLNFNGGTLQANANNNANNTGDFINGNLAAVNVQEGGGTIDANGYSVKIAKSLSGEGAMTFKGGGAIELVYDYTCTGGTTIELGTTVKSTSTDVKTRDTILGNLVVDCSKYYADANNVVVFECTNVSGLTADNVRCINCGDGTAPKVSADGKKILVDFVARPWATVSEDTTWSDLVKAAGGAPASDEIVSIKMTGACTLTIDEDVSVAGIAFFGTGASSSTLAVASNATLSVTGDITGAYVLNNGTVVSDGTVGLKFDNASRGVFVVNSGTLMAVGKKTPNPIAYAGSPIIGNPDETPRSNYLIDVKSGATYDVNGQTSVFASVRLAEGAHFISSVDVADRTWDQSTQLILAGDAEVTANGHFGIYNSASGGRLDIGSHTLTVNGKSGREFMLCDTTISGDGTIYVSSGRFCIRNENSTGSDCTISIGTSGLFENNKHFTVKNFVNNGTISYASDWGRGELEITGRFESKAASFPKLTLTGATLKARTGAEVTVLDTFVASGTITIDASEITKAQLDAAEEQRIAVLTVPTSQKGGTWTVANPPVSGAYVKWIEKGDSKSTLYLCKPKGMMIIIR